MIVGAYSLDLYCDNENAVVVFNLHGETGKNEHTWDEFPHQIVGETRQECFKVARRNGWILNLKTNKAICPNCSGKRSAISIDKSSK